MGMLFSAKLAFLLAVALGLSLGVTYLRDRLAPAFPGHETLVHQVSAWFLVMLLGVLVVAPLLRHFGEHKKSRSEQPGQKPEDEA